MGHTPQESFKNSQRPVSSPRGGALCVRGGGRRRLHRVACDPAPDPRFSPRSSTSIYTIANLLFFYEKGEAFGFWESGQ